MNELGVGGKMLWDATYDYRERRLPGQAEVNCEEALDFVLKILKKNPRQSSFIIKSAHELAKCDRLISFHLERRRLNFHVSYTKDGYRKGLEKKGFLEAFGYDQIEEQDEENRDVYIWPGEK